MSAKKEINEALSRAEKAVAEQTGIPLGLCATARIVKAFLENYHPKNPIVRLAKRILYPGIREIVEEDCQQADINAGRAYVGITKL